MAKINDKASQEKFIKELRKFLKTYGVKNSGKSQMQDDQFETEDQEITITVCYHRS